MHSQGNVEGMEKIELSHEVARSRSTGPGQDMVATWGGDMDVHGST